MMTKMMRVLMVSVLLVGTCSARRKPAVRTYVNPVIYEIGPADPAVVFFQGTYYLYCTGDNSSYHVYTSGDLVHWTKGHKVFEPGERNVWAPDVFHDPSDKKFYLYYTVNKRIGVAVADRPDRIFVDRVTLYRNAIDAHMFCDDGKYYLYYVQLPGFRIHVQCMKTPLEREGEPIEIIRPTEPWEKKRGAVTEGPWMLKHKKTYYLLYSGTGANSLDYAIGYATAANPAGPFTKYAGNPIVHRTDTAFGPGHGCVVADGAGNLWSVYHQQKDDSQPWNRFICIDPLWFDEQGVLHGKATRGTPQPAPALAWGRPERGLRCRLVVSSTDVVTGDPLRFDLVVQNAGTDTICLKNRIGTRGQLYLNDRAVGQEVSPYSRFAFELPADNRFLELQPGGLLRAIFPVHALETLAHTDVDVHRIDSTANPGTYRIHAVYAQRGAGAYPANWWQGNLRSQTVTITVRPRANGGEGGAK